ncbi:VanZ family protein [Coraliomargarita sp. SDUM461004]|uniref:VanZ family protein n=1 Tax=Thalassobacterium sedimentorum TaxID=3041258 RepID=A0ABU1AEU7_9BACT|nr:VanZ family protein [Coraliomargarita sp. SDUM461004]MDQ8193322.1 VanZ family protein [Coraliomargarita sp. SDUM461004]
MRRLILKYPCAYQWPILLALAIFAASGTQHLATPELGFEFSKDKLAHFLVFGLLATSILRTPKLQNCSTGSMLIAALITSAFGACDEIRQSFTPGRSVEIADWVADTSGALVAVISYSYWKRYRHMLEWQLPKQRRIRQRSILTKK